MAKSAQEIKQETEEKETRRTLGDVAKAMKTMTTTAVGDAGRGAAAVGAAGVDAAKNTMKVATEALMQEIPGAAFLRSSMSDMKGYFTGLKERAKEAALAEQDAKMQTKQTEDQEKTHETLVDIDGTLKQQLDLDKEKMKQDRSDRLKDRKRDGQGRLISTQAGSEDGIDEVGSQVSAGLMAGLAGGKVGGLLTKALKGLLKVVKIGFLPIMLLSVATMFKDEIEEFVSGDGIINAFKFITDGLSKMFGSLIEWIKSPEFVDEIFGFVNDAIDVIWSIFKGIGKALFMTIGSIFMSPEEAAAKFDEILGSVENSVDDMIDWFKNWDPIGDIMGLLNNAMLGIKQWVVDTYNSFIGALPGVKKLQLNDDGNIEKEREKTARDKLKDIPLREISEETHDLSGKEDPGGGIAYSERINAIQNNPDLSDQEKTQMILDEYNKFQNSDMKAKAAPKPAPLAEQKEVIARRSEIEKDTLAEWKKLNESQKQVGGDNNIVAPTTINTFGVTKVGTPDSSRRNR